MSPTNRAICSSVPWVAMVGAAKSRPRPVGAPKAPNSAMVLATRRPSLRDTPFPYALGGRNGADQPAEPSRSHQSPTVSSGSHSASSHDRSSDRSSSVGAVAEAAVPADPLSAWAEDPGLVVLVVELMVPLTVV